MDITILSDSNRNDWAEFVQAHPEATFYHRWEWRTVMEKCFGHKTYYLMARDAGRTVGVLPLIHIKSLLFGSILCSMPFLNFGGVCAESDAAQEALLVEARHILNDCRADYLELRHLKPSAVDLHRKEHKVSMTLALDNDPDVLWNNFKSKHRTNIRRAAKNDLQAKFGGVDLLDPFYDIIATGWRDLGTPIYRKSFFRTILETFGDAVEICVVEHQNRPIAAAYNGLFRDTVEGMWIFALREYARLQTNYFIYWEMIRRACEQGYKKYHLGRSTNETGATFFKKKWNAEPRQLYWEYIMKENGGPAQLPELNVDNPKYRLAINTWRRLPLKVTQIVGPLIAKSIP